MPSRAYPRIPPLHLLLATAEHRRKMKRPSLDSLALVVLAAVRLDARYEIMAPRRALRESQPMEADWSWRQTGKEGGDSATPGTAEATLRWLIKKKLEANLEVMTDEKLETLVQGRLDKLVSESVCQRGHAAEPGRLHCPGCRAN